MSAKYFLMSDHLCKLKVYKYVSDESTELKPLTPSMFLRELPTCEVNDINSLDSTGLNRRLKNLQKIREGLKQRFRTEYFALLVHHGKRKNQQVEVGDIVLIGSDMTKRIQWPMGQVIEVFQGVDSSVRVARVKTESGVFTLPQILGLKKNGNQKNYQTRILNLTQIAPL